MSTRTTSSVSVPLDNRWNAPRSSPDPVPSRSFGQLALGSVTRRLGHDPVQVLAGTGEGRALRTDRLLIRPLRATDRSAFLELAGHARPTLAGVLPVFRDAEDDQAMFDRQLRLTIEGEQSGRAWRRVLAIDHGPDAGRLVGAVNLINIRRGFESDTDINYWLDPRLTGHGLATEGVAATLDHAFAAPPAGMGLVVVHAAVQRENLASIAVLRRVNANDTGLSDRFEINGAWVRHAIFRAEAPLEAGHGALSPVVLVGAGASSAVD